MTTIDPANYPDSTAFTNACLSRISDYMIRNKINVRGAKVLRKRIQYQDSLHPFRRKEKK